MRPTMPQSGSGSLLHHARGVAALVFVALCAATGDLGAAPIEQVWSHDTTPFQATDIAEISITASSGRRVVVVGRDEPGSPQYLDTSVWNENGMRTSTGTRLEMFATSPFRHFDVDPTCVRELSTGEFAIAGRYQNSGAAWFIVILDPTNLAPVATIAGESFGTPSKVLVDETPTGDIVVAVTYTGDRAMILRFSRMASGFAIMRRAHFRASTGDNLSVDAMRVLPSGDIAIAGVMWSQPGSGWAYIATIDSATMTPIAAAAYPEVNQYSRFSDLTADGTTIYAAGYVSTLGFPDDFLNMRVLSVPETLGAINWDMTYALGIIPAAIEANAGSSGLDLWVAGTSSNGHHNRLSRLSAASGLPITSAVFQQGHLAGLTGLAIDRSATPAVPVGVGHWIDNGAGPHPIYGLFVRADHNGATACSSFVPQTASATPVTRVPIQLVDDFPPGQALAFVTWNWQHVPEHACITYIGGRGDLPDCPDYASCVACRADLNNDDLLNFFDVAGFLSLYQAQNSIADFNLDGQFNFFDVSAYLGEYQAGCP